MTEIFVFRLVRRRSDGRTEKSELNHFANRKTLVKLCLGKFIKSYSSKVLDFNHNLYLNFSQNAQCNRLKGKKANRTCWKCCTGDLCNIADMAPNNF